MRALPRALELGNPYVVAGLAIGLLVPATALAAAPESGPRDFEGPLEVVGAASSPVVPAPTVPAPTVSAPTVSAPHEPVVAGPGPAPAPTRSRPPATLDHSIKVMVTTAQRYETDAFNTPQSVNVVDSRKLARDIPRTPAEALRDQPGIWVQKTSHIGGAPIIRGLVGNRVLLMVDGIRLNNVGAYAGANNFLQTIDVETVERMEVVRGPGSVNYGSDALGGVVNVITRAPVDWQARGKHRWGGLAKATLGSVDLQRRLRLEAYYGGQRFRVRVGGTLQQVSDLRGGGTIGVQTPSGWKEGNFDVRADFRPAHRHELSAAYWQLGQSNIQRYDTWLGANASVGAAHRRLARLNYTWTDPAPGISSLYAQVYLHDQGTQTRYIARPDVQTQSFLTPGADLQLQSPAARGHLLFTYGLHYHHDRGRSVTDSAGKITNSFPITGWGNAAGFLQARVDPVKYLSFTLAGRYDFYHMVTEPSAASTPAGLDVDDLRVNRNYNAGSGSLGVIGRATEWLNLVANLASGYRAPSVSDSLSLGPFTLGYRVPTPGLVPEKALNFDIGPRINHKNISFTAAYFHTWLRDLIDYEPGTFNGMSYIDANANGMQDDKEEVFVNKNVGRSRIQGVELALEARLLPHWVLMGNFTYVDGRNISAKQPLEYGMPTYGFLALRWQDSPDQRFYVEANTRVVASFAASRVPPSRIERDPSFKVDPQDPNSPLLSGDGTTPGYWLLGLAAGARITEYVETRLTAGNLLNVEYRDKDSRIAGPGLSVVGSLAVRY
jgi:outer membrane receptor protein involved in Fe transport